MALQAHDIIRQLEREILPLQGYKANKEAGVRIGFSPIEKAFPTGAFPVGAIHDFNMATTEEAAATSGFIGGLLSKLMHRGSPCVWVGEGKIFPPALAFYNVKPEQVIFIEARQPKHVLWVVEEALKCETVAAVVGELRDLDLNQSRRLQLAVEQSRVTGLLIRPKQSRVQNIACVSRWNIRPLPSISLEGMPGLGFARWNVELQKVRNGKPGSWQIEWGPTGFRTIPASVIGLPQHHISNTG